jgi:spoIIIJ-associated protein
MLSPEEIKKIEGLALEFFTKTTFEVLGIVAAAVPNEEGAAISVQMAEPKFFIGQNGQTLFEVQRVLRMVLNKALQKNFPITLDINDYQKQKVEHLKKLAQVAANEVALTQQSKMLSAMPAYDRRIIHLELESRQDVATESLGEGEDRHIVIRPKSVL